MLLPVRYRDCEQSFAGLAYDFMAYARERGLFNIIGVRQNLKIDK